MNFIDMIHLAGAIGAGLMAGTFFAFSTFIMAALARVPAAEGIRSMQAINITVINPFFMLAFMGTALISLAQCCFPIRGRIPPRLGCNYNISGCNLFEHHRRQCSDE